MLVNKRELSEILGITERSLTEWQKEGLPVASFADLRGQANEYDTKAVIGWLIQRELQRLNREKPRDRLDRLKADAIELEIKERTGELARRHCLSGVGGSHHCRQNRIFNPA
ncbi:terminase small subunit [Neisseria subflava]|uniref:terminase small subunit n=1 Tax=Neisseria subflava TaxID=28449 RepID=UPI00202A14C0|nr:terminase small subunit [Neisseria subflava]